MTFLTLHLEKKHSGDNYIGDNYTNFIFRINVHSWI